MIELDTVIFIFILIIALGYGLLIGGAFFDFREKYKQGQIDALNGKIKYHKSFNDDGELVWKEKSNNN
jgi:hypothetical protein